MLDKKTKKKIYESHLPIWDKFSSIRRRPRRILDTADIDLYFYPIERQPICVHPLIKMHGEKMIWNILLQTGYKFLADIAFVEIKVVNHISEKIYDGTLNFNFPLAMRHDLLSVIVDEAYHAYVALDVMNQLEEATQIKPCYIPKTNEILNAYQYYINNIIPPEYCDIFEVITICIAENTLTKELFSMTKQENLNPFFHKIMADHMSDEGRHSQLFSELLRNLWLHIGKDEKEYFMKILPGFIQMYQTLDLHIDYNIQLLRYLGFSEADTQLIVEDTFKGRSEELNLKSNPVIHNLAAMFMRSGIEFKI